MALHILTSLACAGIFWTCLCRLAQMDETPSRPVLISYAAVMAAAVVAGIQNWTEPGQLWVIILLLAFLANFGVTIKLWRHGTPTALKGDSR